MGGLCGAVAVVGGLAAIGHALRVEDPLAHADVIVAISGDTGARAETAIALWKAGYAPLILFSGGAEDPSSVSSAELMRRGALRSGVPDGAVLIEPNSSTTEENAERVAELMTDHHLGSAILVTSPFHQRRAAILFARAFGPAHLQFLSHPAADPSWEPDFWWVQEQSRTVTLLEIAKLIGQLANVERPTG